MMNGKTVLITGATNGIGLATAQALAEQGAHVLIVGRNPDKTKTAAAEITARTGAQVDALIADLSVMADVRALADTVLAQVSHLDVLINNAGGVFLDERKTTADGLEMTFALNHMSYFLLTNWLLDLLRASGPARIVNLSSSAGSTVRAFDFDDMQSEQRYSGFGAYAQSKLANVLFTYKLARMLAGTGVTANALHPGVVATGFAANNSNKIVALFLKLSRMFLLTPEKGASTAIYLASSPEVEGVTSSYFIKSKSVRSNPISYDEAVQDRLWDVSAEIARERGFPVP